jgi:hypothetical protein
MLDEVYQTDARLFVNVGTGRFVRKDLPLLRRYYVVAGASGGSIVLAERASPHAARLLNPFTGSLIHYEAPVPEGKMVAAHVVGSSPPTIVLICDGTGSIYLADPDSESFMVSKQEHYACPPIKMALVGGIYAASREDGLVASLLVSAANDILRLASHLFADYFSATEAQAENRCFLVESVGEMLIVFKLLHRVEIFKLDTQSNLLEPVKDIGSRALFVGGCRCLSVDADMFPSVEANCIYYVDEEPLYDICIYSLKDEKEVRAGGGIDSFNPFTLSPKASPPFTVVQLLCSYTFEVRSTGLKWEKMLGVLSALDKEVVARRIEEFLAYDYASEDDDYY